MTIQENFIEVMRGFASTVNVISSQNSSNRQAMTASAVTSLSIDPPCMLICVNKSSSIHNLLDIDSSFCINILTSKQQDLAEICSGKEEGEVRFESGNWSEDDGVPYLSDAQANIFCKCYELIEQSSHTIFIGKVFKIVDSNVKKPLIYLDGQYKN